MSPDRIAVLREAFDAWNSRDMERLRALYDPDVVMFHLEGWPEPGPSVGCDAVMRQWTSQREIWDIDDIHAVTEFREVGDRVIVRIAWHGSGLGPEMRMEMTGVYTVRNGRIRVIEHFWEHADALEAVGLRE